MNRREKYISRVDQPSYSGYLVRFCRKTECIIQKLFSDGKCGGKNKALEMAIKFRDDFISKNPEWSIAPKKSHSNGKYFIYHPRSNTGVVGVHRYCRDDRSYGFLVHWRETNEHGNRVGNMKWFGFDPDDKESEQIAFRSAVRLRERMLKTHYYGPLAQRAPEKKPRKKRAKNGN